MKSRSSHDRSPLGAGLGSAVASPTGPASRGGAQARYGNAFVQERLRAQADAGADADAAEAELDPAGASAPGVATGDAAAASDSPNTGAGETDAVPEVAASDANQQGTSAAGGGALPVIEFSNDRPDAASQSRFNRSVVGVGERLTFSCRETGGTWAATGGVGSVTDGVYAWQAPGVPGRYTISCTVGDRVGRSVITVLAPASITARKVRDVGYGAGTQGAGMEIRLTMNPTTVSFTEAEWREDPGPGTVGGYFERFPASAFDHAPNPEWVEMGTDNAAVTDTASFHDWGAPWSEGIWTWTIPNRYRVAGDGSGQVFTTVTQSMAIAGRNGVSTVSKLGQSSTRAPG
jgi:hypothetical protein